MLWLNCLHDWVLALLPEMVAMFRVAEVWFPKGRYAPLALVELVDKAANTVSE